MRMKATCYLLGLLLMLSGCDFQQQADQQFGDQHFKTAIALIELHKTRFGEYPANLEQIKYIGAWDPMALQSVQYQKQADGYTLEVSRGWVAKPGEFDYPPEFWQGLGIKNRPHTKPTSQSY